MRYLIDTDIWSYYRQRRFGVAARIDALPADDLAISRVSVAELQVWARGADTGTRRGTVDALSRRCRLLEVSKGVWSLYPRAQFELKRIGRTVGMADVLIGCCAALHGLTVVSNNRKHFEPVCEVLAIPLENWAEPPRAASP